MSSGGQERQRREGLGSRLPRKIVDYAHINVKPKGGRGQATHGNLTVTCIPRVRILIVSSFNYKEQKKGSKLTKSLSWHLATT